MAPLFHLERAAASEPEGLDLRVMVWAGGTALGLLAALGATAHSWALLVAAIPMATLGVVIREHANARRQSQRAEALFAAAGQIHAEQFGA